MKTSRCTSNHSGHIGLGVGPSGVLGWLRARRTESVSVPQDRIQKSSVCREKYMRAASSRSLKKYCTRPAVLAGRLCPWASAQHCPCQKVLAFSGYSRASACIDSPSPSEIVGRDLPWCDWKRREQESTHLKRKQATDHRHAWGHCLCNCN